MKKVLLLFSIVILFLGLIGFRAYQQHQLEQQPIERERIKVETVSPETKLFTEKLHFAATLEPEEEAAVVCKVPSKTVLRVFVNEGDIVKAGTILAELDESLISEQINQAAATLSKAKIYYRTLKNDFERFSALYKEEVISRQHFEHIDGEYKTSKKQVKEAQAALEQLKILKSYHKIEAPISGVITARNLDPGDTTSSTPAFMIAKNMKVKAVGSVPEKVYPRVRVGQKASLQLDAFPGRQFEASVSRISPTLDAATRTGKVEVLLDSLSILKPGMFARTVIELETHEGLALPLEAVGQMAGTGQSICYVRTKEDTAELRYVTLGDESKGMIEILDGLSSSDEVILTRSEKVSEGVAIEVVHK